MADLRRPRRKRRRPRLTYTDKVHLQRWAEAFDFRFALAVAALAGAVVVALATLG